MATYIFPYLLCILWTQAAWAADITPPRPLDFDPPWELVADRAHTKLYKHPWPNNGINTFKVVMTMDAPAEKILSVITDVALYPEWVPNCRKAEVIQKNGSTSLIYYLALDMPWPAMNRDWVNELAVVRDAGTGDIVVSFTAIDHLLPSRKGYLRVREHIAFWVLTPIGKNKTRSIWQWYTDPGGRLPDWLVRWATRDQVMRSIQNLNGILAR